MVAALSTFGWVVAVVVFAHIWIALAFRPARVARCKGHSFVGYFILSLFFFRPALITSCVVDDRAAPAY